jgi:hypothetical protein
MNGGFRVGEMVTRADGTPGLFMVIRLLENGQVRIKGWPILLAPPAEDVDASDLRPAPTKEAARE